MRDMLAGFGLLLYTAGVVLACRRRWAHRCAECHYRHRGGSGRHRASRPAALPAGRPAPALPAGPDPDATSPMRLPAQLFTEPVEPDSPRPDLPAWTTWAGPRLVLEVDHYADAVGPWR